MFHTVLFWYMVLWVPVGGNDGLETASVVFLYLFFLLILPFVQITFGVLLFYSTAYCVTSR